MKLRTRRMFGIVVLLIGNLFLIFSGIVIFIWMTLPSSVDKSSRGLITASYYGSKPGLWTNFLSGAKFSTTWMISDWRTNMTLALRPMFIETNVPPDVRQLSYRLALLDSKVLSWGFYEAKCIGLNGDAVLFPAIGPLSGTHMKWRWPIAFLGVSIAFIGCGVKIKKSVQSAAGG